MSRFHLISTLVVLFIWCNMRIRCESNNDDDDDRFLTDEEIALCRQRTNYNGNFSDSSHEMKCFLECGLVTVDLMEKDTGKLNMTTFNEYLKDEEGDTEFLLKIINACMDEVVVGPDHCETAFDYVTCAIKKVLEVNFIPQDRRRRR